MPRKRKTEIAGQPVVGAHTVNAGNAGVVGQFPVDTERSCRRHGGGRTTRDSQGQSAASEWRGGGQVTDGTHG